MTSRHGSDITLKEHGILVRVPALLAFTCLPKIE